MKVWRYLSGSYKTKKYKAIEDLRGSEDFQNYQSHFDLLVPARQVYIEDDELVIKTKVGTFSEWRYNFNWEDPDILDRVFEVLEREYSALAKQNIYTIKTDQVTTDHPAIDFVEMTLRSTMDWDEWVNTYFHPESPGYELFKEMERDISLKHNEYPPHKIWALMLQDMESLGTLYVQKPTVYDFPNTVEIIDQNGCSWAYVSFIDNKWYYMGITKSCLDYIWALYSN